MRRNRLLLAVAAVALLLAVNAVLVVAQPGLALPRSLWTYLVGPKMVRAEVIVLDRGVVHYYRVDRGRIVAKTPASLTLRTWCCVRSPPSHGHSNASPFCSVPATPAEILAA